MARPRGHRPFVPRRVGQRPGGPGGEGRGRRRCRQLQSWTPSITMGREALVGRGSTPLPPSGIVGWPLGDPPKCLTLKNRTSSSSLRNGQLQHAPYFPRSNPLPLNRGAPIPTPSRSWGGTWMAAPWRSTASLPGLSRCQGCSIPPPPQGGGGGSPAAGWELGRCPFPGPGTPHPHSSAST